MRLGLSSCFLLFTQFGVGLPSHSGSPLLRYHSLETPSGTHPALRLPGDSTACVSLITLRLPQHKTYLTSLLSGPVHRYRFTGVQLVLNVGRQDDGVGSRQSQEISGWHKLILF